MFEWTAVAKLLAPLATKIATGQLQKRTLSRRIASAASKRLKKDLSLEVDKKLLHRWISAPSTTVLLVQHTESGLADLNRNFAQKVLNSTDAPFVEVAAAAMTIVVEEILTHFDLSAALHIQTQRGLSQGAEILEKIDAQPQLEQLLYRFPPILRTFLTDEAAGYPDLKAAMVVLARSSERGDLLQQWSEQLPPWAQRAPGTVLALLGALSQAFDRPAAACTLVHHALDAGCFERGFWFAWTVALTESADPSRALEVLRSRPIDHPYWIALEHAWEGRTRDAVAELDSWQTANDFLESQKELLAAQLTVTIGNNNAAITRYVRAAQELQSGSAGIQAAELLLWRGTRSDTTTRLSDTRRALQLALEARDRIREWGGSSAKSVVIAAKAAHLNRSSERAWQITRPAPDGEATVDEAASRDVVIEAAMAAALTRRNDAAQILADEASSPFTTAMIGAMRLDFDSAPTAAEAYRAAFEKAETDSERVMAASGMAELGVDPPKEPAMEGHKEALQELRFLASVMSATDRLPQLRANRSRSPMFTVKLAEELDRNGAVDDAGDSLLDGARQFSDPTMALMAADRYRQVESFDRAQEAAETALSIGGPSWNGTQQTRALLVELSWAQHDWDRAVETSRSLLDLDDENPRYNWAFVRSLTQRGDLEIAWEALNRTGSPLAPHNEDDASTWVNLMARFSESGSYVADAIRLMRRWPEDERLLATFLQAFHTAPKLRMSDYTDTEGAQIQAVTEEFVTRFPESPYLRSVTIGPPENPLLPFEDALKSRYKATSELIQAAQSGKFPLGAVASILGGSYTDACLRRAGGAVLAFNPDLQGEEDAAAFEALNAVNVGIDQSAFHTLTLLPVDVRNKMLGSFRSTLTTAQAFRDAVVARDELAQKSTMSISWNPDDDRPSVFETSEEEARVLAERSDAIVNMMRRMRRQPRPELKTRDAAKLRNNLAWLALIDFLSEKRWPLWSDDLTQRHLARAMGVPAFSSLNLVHVLRSTELITTEQAEAFLVSAIRNYYLFPPFDTVIFRAAAAEDNWQAAGVAMALSKGATWADPKNVEQFALECLSQAAARPEVSLAGWGFAISRGLIELASDPEEAAKNVSIILRSLINKSWVLPTHLQKALTGAREALAKDEREFPDPLMRALNLVYAGWSGRFGHEVATMMVMNIVGQLSTEDRALAARVCVTYKDE